jgi:hypothetical protein
MNIPNAGRSPEKCRLFYGNGKDSPVFRATDLIAYLRSDRRHHYRDGYSMAEAAKCWVHADGNLPASIVRAIGVKPLEAAHFEYEVGVWGGGTSTTDVMAFVPDGVIAVEAKVHEPFDEEVGCWIVKEEVKNPRSPLNRRRVVDRYARAFGVAPEVLLNLRYQLLHRTLSAALVAGRFGLKNAWMIAHSFGGQQDQDHMRNRADFDRYVALVGAKPTLEGVQVGVVWVDELAEPILTANVT